MCALSLKGVQSAGTAAYQALYLECSQVSATSSFSIGDMCRLVWTGVMGRQLQKPVLAPKALSSDQDQPSPMVERHHKLNEQPGVDQESIPSSTMSSSCDRTEGVGTGLR